MRVIETRRGKRMRHLIRHDNFMEEKIEWKKDSVWS